jgi:predicted alpha/beta-fold hydrolase
VDCRSDSGDTCSSAYQASLARHQDVFQLILQVKKDFPSIQKIWLVGTSMGTISSSFMPTYDSSIYAGAIHTASINETYIRHAYVEMRDFDYKRAKLPQVFIHHQDDPCIGTTYSSAKSISEKFQIPLITVQGGGDFRGEACKAFTQHGFRGKEREVMLAIQKIILTGQVTELVIQ